MTQKELDEVAEGILTKLREGYVMDLRKPDIDKFERASIISRVLEDKGWSIREMARQYNIPRSTIEDWLLFNRISEERYTDLIEKGISHTEIYHELRSQKSSLAEKSKVAALDVWVKRWKEQLDGVDFDEDEWKYSDTTADEIDALIERLEEVKDIVLDAMGEDFLEEPEEN